MGMTATPASWCKNEMQTRKRSCAQGAGAQLAVNELEEEEELNEPKHYRKQGSGGGRKSASDDAQQDTIL